jgi:hypothetical protein
MSREVGTWLVFGWQAIATIVFASWVLSDITKPGLRTEPRSWRQFTTDYGFYLLISLGWPIAGLFLLITFAWVLLTSHVRRSP